MAKMRIKLLSPTFRVSFPSVFTASAAPGSEKKEYSVTALFDKAKVASDPVEKDLFIKMKQAMADCAKDEWGTKIPANLQSPFHEGTEKEYSGYGEGIQYVRFSTLEKNGKPGIVGPDAKTRITEESDFYAGCYARATIVAAAWTYLGKNGIKFYLQNIQKVADGEPLGGGRAKAESDFDATGDAPAAPDAFEDMFK